MKALINYCSVLGLCCFFSISAWSEDVDSESECFQAILANRDFVMDRPSHTVANATVDSAILTASSVIAVPTLGATLAGGVVLVAGHQLLSSAIKEGKVSGHNRLLALLKEASLFEKSNDQSLDEYPRLKELWYRVNGPLFKKITPQQVASSVLKAEYDIEFCSNSDNYQLVHFKDYVLDDING